MRDGRWEVASGDADFAPYLADQPAASAEMFMRFIEMARACGPVTFELQNGRVVLRGTRRIFASVRARKQGLDGHINLARSVADRRFRKVEMLTKRLYFHRYGVTSLSELDEQFGRWLCEAREIGDGSHLTDSDVT
jgi:Domain of unknown function (DUF5655)